MPPSLGLLLGSLHSYCCSICLTGRNLGFLISFPSLSQELSSSEFPATEKRRCLLCPPVILMLALYIHNCCLVHLQGVRSPSQWSLRLTRAGRMRTTFPRMLSWRDKSPSMRGPPTDMEGRKEAEALMWLLDRGRRVGRCELLQRLPAVSMHQPHC